MQGVLDLHHDVSLVHYQLLLLILHDELLVDGLEGVEVPVLLVSCQVHVGEAPAADGLEDVEGVDAGLGALSEEVGFEFEGLAELVSDGELVSGE